MNKIIELSLQKLNKINKMKIINSFMKWVHEYTTWLPYHIFYLR